MIENETKNGYASESGTWNANASRDAGLPYLLYRHHVRCGHEEEVNAIHAEGGLGGQRVRL